MRVEDSALTPDVRIAQVRKGTRLPSGTTKLSVSRSARSAVTRFVPSYPAFQVTPPYLTATIRLRTRAKKLELQLVTTYKLRGEPALVATYTAMGNAVADVADSELAYA